MGELSTLVDTSVLIGRAEGGLGSAADGGWAISAVAIGELHAGVLVAERSATRAARLRRLTAVLSVALVLDVDGAVAESYGELRAASGRSPTNDLWIAATALAHDLTLLTRDEAQAALPLVRTTLIAAGG